MKKSTLLIIFSAFVSVVFAQKEIILQRSAKGLHIVHTVASKENFYSVGRLYNVPAKDIATYNALDMSHGLVAGKNIYIPLSAANFSIEKVTSTPVYYVVGEKEGLFRVSSKNNNVTMANIRKWNNLTSDKITPGQKLIVGYLMPAGEMPAVATTPSVEKKESPQTQVSEIAETKVADVKEEAPKVEKKIATPRPEPARAVVNTSSGENGGGYFRGQFAAQVQTNPAQNDVTITAGIFKTSSGWQDAKYYALMDNAEPGTIVKIINPNNNKSVYAKVLDKMAGIRQNQGYDLRMSNAAATALGIDDTDKFFVRVVY